MSLPENNSTFNRELYADYWEKCWNGEDAGDLAGYLSGWKGSKNEELFKENRVILHKANKKGDRIIILKKQ